MSSSVSMYCRRTVEKYSIGMNKNKFEHHVFLIKKGVIANDTDFHAFVLNILDFEEIRHIKNKFILESFCRMILFCGNFSPAAIVKKVLRIKNKTLILLLCELLSIKYRRDYIYVFYREISSRKRFAYLMPQVEEIMSTYYNGLRVLRNKVEIIQDIQNTIDKILPQQEIKRIQSRNKFPPIGNERIIPEEDQIDQMIKRIIHWTPLV